MPWTRRFGSHLLTWMTRRAIGLSHLSDSQCGYTAISGRAIDALELSRRGARAIGLDPSSKMTLYGRRRTASVS